ncbi:MAG: nuclear transport factor 2 family protein [Pseudomonadota bacterium]
MNQHTEFANDRTTIVKVIEKETAAFAACDFDGWADCWVQDHRTREVCVSTTFGVTVTEGWEALSTYMAEVFSQGQVCDIVEFQRNNLNISVNRDTAVVVFDGRSTQGDGRVETTYETRVLERHAGEWRILYSSFILRGHQRIDKNRVAIDAKGKVLCAPERALKAIEAHPGLQISHGILRGAKREWDKVLQAGIKCAAGQHKYFQHYRHQSKNGRDFRLPLVLGETDTGGVAVCTLFVRDEMTFVDVQTAEDLDDRLTVAKAIFGLSDGQLGLAHRIVEGDNLTSAAATLGISVNTARTHLSRIYDKTGVHSQTALVRTLLSVG